MPQDLAVLSRVIRSQLTPAELEAVGNADFYFTVFNNDIQFDSFGLINTITGTGKLAQAALKALLTDLGTHAEDTLYGSSLYQYLGMKNGQEMYSNITNGIANCLREYNALNMDNNESDEFIESITGINIYSDANDPRKVTIKVSITAESGKLLNVDFPFLRES